MSHSREQNSADRQHVVKGSEVFVGGLARHTTENKIHENFSSCGEIVEIRLIKDQQGNSKGYCFVRFAKKEAADKAVKEKSGSLLDGKKIGVLPSADQVTLFFGNLPKDWSSDGFDKIVRQVLPDVVSVDLAKPLSSGDTLLGQKQQNRGFAFVKFSSHAAAARAYRAGSKSDFLLADNCHPIVEWAKDEPDIDPEELAKIKIAFVRNLPTNSDENYLKKLFEPLGKLDKVVLSKKGRSTVGFVHFADRSNLENAVKEMNERTVQGPNGGPSFMLMVEVARPLDKNKKRARADAQVVAAASMGAGQSKFLMDDQIVSPYGGSNLKTQKVKYSMEESVVSDPYEAAVVSLSMAVKERLLRILRLGIATRFDIDIQCITSLKELPESIAISVLDQFMLSGADRLNKGAYLSGLISRHQVDKLGLDGHTLSLRGVGDSASVRLNMSSFSSRVPEPVADPLPSRLLSSGFRYDGYTSGYTSLLPDYPLSSRTDYRKLEEVSPARLHQAPYSSTLPSRIGLHSQRITDADNQPARPQVRFDPYTGEPYKFDPFTGEPIRPESSSRGPY